MGLLASLQDCSFGPRGDLGCLGAGRANRDALGDGCGDSYTRTHVFEMLKRHNLKNHTPIIIYDYCYLKYLDIFLFFLRISEVVAPASQGWMLVGLYCAASRQLAGRWGRWQGPLRAHDARESHFSHLRSDKNPPGE